MSSVQIVVTCSDRKRVAAPRRLSLRTLPSCSVRERAALWIDRIRHERVSPVVAKDLYAGEHWQAVLDLHRAAVTSGFRPSLWICSAGYGLLKPDSFVKPYQATFTRGHADSVTRKGEDAAASTDWWRDLCRWKGPRGSGERSITELAISRPRTPLLLVASPAYIKAVCHDALAAGEVLGDRMILVSVGARSLGELGEFQVPATARLQSRVGGSKIGLNARVAELLLTRANGDLRRESVVTSIERLSSRLPALPVYDRIPLTDAQVSAWIRRAIRIDPSVSASSALRRLRDEGNACEQRRFARLFDAVEGVSVGS